MLKSIATLFLIIVISLGCKNETTSKEVVFVCTHGAARSPIASAYFNKLTKEKGLNYHGVFRGTEPSQQLSKETIIGLEKDGFHVSDWKPTKVTDQDIQDASTIVTFDCSVASHSLTKHEWNGTPPISKDYTAARNIIKEHVENLVSQLDNNE